VIGIRIRRAVAAALWATLAATTAHGQAVKPVTLARGLAHPWGLAFLPGSDNDMRMLVTERPGRLRVVHARGAIGPPVSGVPEVDAVGEGGLLDVALDPRFSENGWIYLSYVEPVAGGTNSTVVARARLDVDGLQGRLSELQVLFRQRPKVASSVHFGSRLLFARDGRLFVSLGEGGQRDDAQTLGNHHGKLVRIEPDGRAPADNPFVGRAGALPEIWSYGHRNVQGLAFHPQTGELWADEHGPQGGDELNVIEPGHNYGWPVITYGTEYGSGRKIGEGHARPGMDQPIVHWTPAIAPSGMSFLTSDRYPGWKGDLFIGALRGRTLLRLQIDGRRVVRQERLLQDFDERIRDVRQGPDGWLYLLTDSADGRIVRLER
jgi:glucose/arabinose dehydrogenase